MKKMWSKKGFTLTELVVAMMLVAGIAMILMPSLVADNEKQVYATALKKVYAQLQQTYQAVGMLQARGQISQGSMFYAYKDTLEKTTKIVPDNQKIKYLDAYSAKPDDCVVVKDVLKCPNGIVLKNGMFLFFDENVYKVMNKADATKQESEYYIITVDVNGKKSPNTVGKDIFYFLIKKDIETGITKIVPRGEPHDNDAYGVCSAEKNDYTGCAYRILEGDGNGKIDYY